MDITRLGWKKGTSFCYFAIISHSGNPQRMDEWTENYDEQISFSL